MHISIKLEETLKTKSIQYFVVISERCHSEILFTFFFYIFFYLYFIFSI